jgi:Uma2 family endonuclease
MPVALRKFYSEEEFLALERMAKIKSEYYRGEIFAMSGASFQHNQIAAALARELGQFLDDKKYNIFGSDLRVYTQLNSFYTYPDAVIICDEPSFIDNEFDTLLNPTVLIEILSDSTEQYDRTIKFDFYKNIPTLKQYVLIDSRKILIEVYTKLADKSWQPALYNNLNEEWELTFIGYKGPVKNLYKNVQLKK